MPKLSDFPEVFTEFHPEKNGDIEASKITVGSRTKYWWQCDKGHEWMATPNSRLGARSKGKIQGCPICSGRAPSSTNNLLTKYPDIASEWSSKNDLNPEDYTPKSGAIVLWICPNGHEYESRIANRTHENTQSGCPFCKKDNAPTRVSSSYNLEITNPELLLEWDFEQNTVMPSEVTAGSKRSVHWICASGHKFQSQINGRTNGRGCPFCSGNKVGYGNDLFTDNPSLCAEWHPTKNRGLLPSDVTANSSKKVWWICERGHEWDAVISARNTGGRGCPKCTNQSSRAETRLLCEMLFLFPKTISRHKVEGVEIDVFIPSLDLGIEYDGAHWHKEKIEQDKNKNKFLDDKGIHLLRVRQSPLQRLESNDLICDEVEISKSTIDLVVKKIMHICQIESRELFEYLQRDSFVNDDLYKLYLDYFPSPFPEDSFGHLHPEVASGWHPTKNIPLTPANFSSKSSYKAWWKCNCGHEWIAPISNRTPSKTSAGSGCPVCSGRIATAETCLAVTHPEIAREWHPKLNGTVTPQQVKAGSKIQRWWLCPNGHVYKNTPNQRKHNKYRSKNGSNGCPVCSGRRLKYEIPPTE